jgi:hypothetical protein
VFGNPEATWESGWTSTKAWAEPFADLVAAVYVVDEPGHNGILSAQVSRAVERVRRDGYRTMIAETAQQATRGDYRRPAVDLFGTTCYDWPGFGSWTLERCREAYRTHPDWNVAIGQGFDWHVHGGRQSEGSESITSQMLGWAEIGRQRQGVVFWVWRWPGQEGIGDNSEALAAYRKGAGM